MRIQGHTLIEVVMAVAVLGVVLVGVAGTVSTVLVRNQVEQDRLRTSTAARSVMEQLEALPYSELPDQDGLQFEVLGLQGAGGAPAGYVAVEDLSGGDGAVYEVRVEVRDPGAGAGGPLDLALVTRRARP